MGKAIFLSFLSILFPLHENIIFLQNDVHCKEVDLLKFIEFPYGHKCLEIVFKRNEEVACILKLLGRTSLSLKMTTFMTFKYRDIISSEAQGNCQTFLIIGERITDVKEIFQLDQKLDHKKQFFPFSKIYFYLFENVNYFQNNNSITRLKNFLIRNALFGYLFEITNGKLEMGDLLTSDVKRSISSYTPSDLFHPMVDTRLPKDNFRISLFNLRPFAFYRENASYNTIINEMDGTEFRFVKEVTKNWKKTFNLRDFSRTKLSPYIVMSDDLSNDSSDMAMCNFWISAKRYPFYEFSTFYDAACTTFLVPKPRKLNEATSIYTALNTSVWLLFLVVFLLSSISLNFVSKLENRLYRRQSQYMNFSSTVLETIGLLLSQSLQFLSNGQLSLQIILTSWILFSMWMGICYTTIYTSRLTSPSYEKPINTVKQFLDQDMYMCGRFISIDEFRYSVIEDYRKLNNRKLIYGENKLYRRQLIAERKCGFFVQLPSENYVTFETDEDEDLVPTFRIMKDCVLSHFTGFAFQKYSPYSKLFNWHIRRYQEHGIIMKWYSDFSKEQERYKPLFEDHPTQNIEHRINLVNVSGAFFLLCIGLLISVLSFLAEIIMLKFALKYYRHIFSAPTNSKYLQYPCVAGLKIHQCSQL